MATVDVPTGILAGKTLQIWDAEAISQIAESMQSRIDGASFYQGELRRKTFRGKNFVNCNFARCRFDHIVFRKCVFTKVDFTRCRFLDCSFSECKFVDCDPYYAYFVRCIVDPSAFKNCYREDGLWNKALILFASLRLGLEKSRRRQDG